MRFRTALRIYAMDSWQSHGDGIGHTLASPITVSSSYQYFLKVFNHVGGTNGAMTRRITYNMAFLGVSG